MKQLDDNDDGKLPPTQSPNSPKRVSHSQTAVQDIDDGKQYLLHPSAALIHKHKTYSLEQPKAK
jgi:hypothetical protein